MCGKGSNTTTSTTGPNPQAMAAYSDVLGKAASAGSTPYAPYTGEEVAPINQQQMAGVGGINAAAGQAQSGIQAGFGQIQGSSQPITASQIQGYESPYTNDVVNATEADFAHQNAVGQAGVVGNAAAQNALGGDRVGVAQALTAEGQSRAQAPVIAGLRNTGFQTALGAAENQQRTGLAGGQAMVGAAGAGQAAAMQGANAQIGAGTLEQGTQQAQDTQARQDYFQKMGYPFQIAQYLASIDTAVGSQMGGQSTTQGPEPNQWAQVAGAGLTAAAMFSDRRMKENIQKVGKLNDGQTIYRFNYKGDKTTQIGLMHDEVEERHPEATHMVSGVGAVDYRKATDDSVRKAWGGSISGFADGGAALPDMVARGRGIMDQDRDNSSRFAARINAGGEPASMSRRDVIDFLRTPIPGFAPERRHRASGGYNGPWGGSDSWVPSMQPVHGKGPPAAPAAPKQQGLSADQMKGVGVLGKDVSKWWGNQDADPGSASNPLPGLSPDDYAARGGRIRRYATGGFAYGGPPEWLDDAVADNHDYTPTVAGLGATEPAVSFNSRFDAAPAERPDDAKGRNYLKNYFSTGPTPDSQAALDRGFQQPDEAEIIPFPKARPPNADKPIPPNTGEVDTADAGVGAIDRAAHIPAPANDDESLGYQRKERTPGFAPTSLAPPQEDKSWLERLGVRVTPELKQGLLQAGLAMMATHRGGPGSFLGAAGEAGMAGVGAFEKTRQQQVENEREQAKFEEHKAEAARPYKEMTVAQKAAHDIAVLNANKEKYLPGGSLVTSTGAMHQLTFNPSTGEYIDAVTKKPPTDEDKILPKSGKMPVNADDAKALAEYYVKTGDPTRINGLGITADARQAVQHQIKDAQDRLKVSDEELATKRAEWEGRKAGQRVLGTQEAKMGSAAFEAEGAMNLARGTIDKVPRTSFLPLNKLIEGYSRQTLNPDQVELYGRAQAIVNTYAAVMARGANVTTDSARAHAAELLNTAGNHETWNRMLDTMQQEIDMAKHSPARMREFYRQQYGPKALEGETPGGGSTPAASGKAKTITQGGYTYTLQPDGSYK